MKLNGMKKYKTIFEQFKMCVNYTLTTTAVLKKKKRNKK